MKHHFKMVVSFVLASGLAACGGGGSGSLPSTIAMTDQPRASNHVVSSSASAIGSYTDHIMIDSGSTTAVGSWSADSNNSSSGWNGFASTTKSIDTSRLANAAPEPVYQSQRYGGVISYAIPNLAPMSVNTVRLHFAESYFTGPAQRLFNASINGKVVLSNFDIYAAAGGSNIAVIKEFPAAANASGEINITLTGTKDYASIAAVEVVGSSTTPGPTSAVLIDAGGSTNGNWLADKNYSDSNSRVVVVATDIDSSHISNPPPQQVLRSQRFGSPLLFSIPNLTPKAAYTVRLDFAESYWTSPNKRVFSVSINGSRVLNNFDIFASAGGANIAVARQFDASADANGKLVVRFDATVNFATIAGIEIHPADIGLPTPTPSPLPSPSPITGPPSPVAYPDPGWVPYSGGAMTQTVPTNPAIESDSASIINAMWNGRSTDAGQIGADSNDVPPSSHDFSQPLYIGQASDPVYIVHCVLYGGGCPVSGQSVHIPRGAYAAGGSDHHIAVRDVPSGKDFMMWEWTTDQTYCSGCNSPSPTGAGGSVNVGWGTAIPSGGNGLNAVGGTASGVSALWAIRATDLEHNTINHAIPVAVNGESPDGYVYPAVGWDNAYFHPDPWPKMGAHFWLDVAPPYASDCPQYAVSYLTALNKYGAYFVDQGGTNWVFSANTDSDISYMFQGGASAWGPLMQSVGQPNRGMGSISVDNCGINMQQHMHVLNPPSMN